MARVLRRLALLALSVSAWCLAAAPSRVLFPNPLHLTRQVHDPVSNSTTTIDEYCSGNRMVAISAEKTVVVDYEKQEITEIDRRAGTYSVTRFDEMATAVAEMRQSTKAAKPQQWKVTPRGVRGAANGKSLEQFEFVDDGEIRRKVDVGIDRTIALSRDAVEVLIGAAYPNPSLDEHAAVLRAASGRPTEDRIATNAASEDQPYGLPVTQEFTYSDTGSEVTFKTAITRVGAETVPADALIIPPAAKRVESRTTALRRQLRDLDHPPTSAPREN